MSKTAILTSLDARGVATVTFNRPEVNNAYNEDFIQGVLSGLDDLGKEKSVRAVVLKGNGRHFQAGADLKWINSVRPQNAAVNRAVSAATAAAVDRLNRLPVPVVALVQGGCFGGGTGIVAACDVVIAADNAIFSIAEVRWGLHAAIIVPHLNDAIGVRQVRRYAITGERFDAQEARRIGLVHEVVALDRLEARGAEIVAQILENSSAAMAKTKQHILESAWSGFDEAAFERLVDSHASARQTADAAEGLASFAEKRRAAWAPKS
ncbi:MAG: enoyl-CoA hydratase-related protein [Hyphomicrobiaceae bacterium]|nr:enoyl-CoA hydratase-related protein [Hyphomicrobiaceae bacterium]